MTSVLIIGSSHIGALKNAEDRFAPTHPELALSWFGMRGPEFLQGTFADDGVFQPATRNDADRDLLRRTNGKAEIATQGYDRLVMIGYRFGFDDIASLLEHHDLLGTDARAVRPALELPLIEDAIDMLIDVTLAPLCDMLAPLDRPATLILAPYPAQGITARAPKMDMARELAAFWNHPAAATVFELWQNRVSARIAQAGHDLLLQPTETIAAPFATQDRFAQSPEQFDGTPMRAPDFRHMNADYGHAVLTALAARLTTAETAPRPAPTLINERI